MKALRSIGRWFTIRAAGLLLGRPKGAPVGTPRKVLVIRTDERVGNVLLTIPLLRALRRGLPEAEIVFLHAASKGLLVRGLPYVDRLEPFEKKRFFRAPLAFWRQLLRLRREGFDLIIEAGHWDAFSLTAALLTRFFNPGCAIGHDRGPAASFFDHPVPAPKDTIHDVSVKLGLLQPLGIPPAGLELETPLSSDEKEIGDIRERLAADGVDVERILVVNPGARVAIRRWSPEATGEAARRIAAAHNLQPVIIWGPGEEELARAIQAHAGPAAKLAPPTNLAQLAALLSLARLVVTNDTGPMHLAVACGVPTLAIFFATDPARWGHPLPRFRALTLPSGGPEEIQALAETAAALLNAVDLPSTQV